LWSELEQKVNQVPVLNRIGTLKDYTERHLSDSKNDGHLHFDAVQEGQFLLSHEPSWIHSYWIDAIWSQFSSRVICMVRVATFTE